MRTLGRYRNLSLHACSKVVALGLRRTVRFKVDLIRVDHRR